MNERNKLHTESSETLRETTQFQLYFLDYTNFLLPQHKRVTPGFIDFLEWFVGFSEGDGSFICTTNKRNLFILNQKEKSVLQKIRTNLGFGTVSTYGNHSRYIVADRKSIDRLICIFNGNLHLEKTHQRFVRWVLFRNQFSQEEIMCKERYKLKADFLGKNSWLAGFIDAEGCFNANRIVDSRYTLGFRVRLRFFLDQRGEREVLRNIRDYLGGGSVALRGKEEMWRLNTWSLKTHQRLLNYLDSHKLRSQKQIDKTRFSKLYRYIINRRNIPWKNKVLARVNKLLYNSNASLVR